MEFLPFITRLSSRSPRLEYFAIIVWNFDSSNFSENKNFGKRDRRGEWVLCDEVEFLSVLRSKN
jgi:hypothetical protein